MVCSHLNRFCHFAPDKKSSEIGLVDGNIIKVNKKYLYIRCVKCRQFVGVRKC